MLKYLIILLDDTSVSYCNYDVTKKERKLIGIDVLKAGILFAMKENLIVQFVYPCYELPKNYLDLIDSVDHIDIKSITITNDSDVIVLSGWENRVPQGSICILHTSIKELACHLEQIKDLLKKVIRLNVVFNDIEAFRDNDIDNYKNTLANLAEIIVDNYKLGGKAQLNLLTDRMVLNAMNNCNAGVESITLAANGKFYVCPAFYYNEENNSIGDPEVGLVLPNSQLLCLEYAPICRNCDAFQCKRCVWLNNRLTTDLNTPSHQQCVLSHLEKNASREILLKLDKAGISLDNSQPIEYSTELDPLNTLNRWK